MTQDELLALIEKAAAEEWTELDLSGQYLTDLPPEIGQLHTLERLDLGHNQKTGRYNHLTYLPATIGQLTNLRSLNLRNNKLSTLPDGLAQLRNLYSLNLSSNELTFLPEGLAQLKKLQSLNLSSNKLTSLSDELVELANLHSLDLSALRLNTWPVWLGKLTKLQSLDLSFNNLGWLPKGLGELANLQHLGLGGLKLSTLPEWLGGLTNLQSLYLRSNSLRTLPEWLGQLTSLHSLNINRNDFSTLPEWMAQLMHLKSLDVGFNNLSILPEWLEQLTSLESLDISRNHLIILPMWFEGLTILQSLNLSYNNLNALPERFEGLTRLETFSLSNNNLGTLPEWLRKLTNLQSLNLSNNNLSILPDWLGGLTNLHNLNLSHNKLNLVPEWLRGLTNLQSLSLGGFNLSVLPDWLGELTNLRSLDLGNLKFGMLPEWLGGLANLQSLDISRNRLHILPEWFGRLTNLQILDLSYNNLNTLPEWLGGLKNLQILDLGGNELRVLPEWLVDLPGLTFLLIRGNPIVEPSPEILGDALTRNWLVDIDTLRRYYVQLREVGTDIFYEAKLLIIGEGGTGKTSLARKLQDPAAPLSPEQESTEGIEIVTWHFPLPPGSPETHYRVNVWDFGGQSVYFATHQFFLTRRSVYVLVTDTRQQHTDFYTWLRMQETFGGDSPVILLKNQNRRHGSRFTIENLSQLRERFANLKEADIELDLNNVPDEAAWPQLLRELEYRFMGLDHVGKARPKTWVAVRQVLQQDDWGDTITRQQYLNICAEQGIPHEADALQLSDYLHNLGDILHFQDDAVLADIVILQPTWGLDAVYRVLDNDTISSNWGQFTWANLRTLWHEARYARHHHHLLRLMQNFQLCYSLPDRPDTFIAPQLLKPDVRAYPWDASDNLQLRYRYPVFMPRGILSRAIVKLHHRIEEQTLVWRSGVILNDGYARAELLELRGESEIRIRIAGHNKRDLLMEVVRALDELHQGFPKLRYEKLIPCNCVTCKDLGDPHFFDLKELLDRQANRKDTIECKKPPYENVPIRGLLDDAVWQMVQKPGYDHITDREAIYHVYGDFYQGGRTEVGDIAGSAGVAIGRETQAAAILSPKEESMSNQKQKPVKSAWANGLFYLFVFVVVIAGLGFLANSVSFSALIAILIAGLLFIPLIGALQLRQDDNLSEKNFLELIRLVLAQLPLIGRLFPVKDTPPSE